jgi:adenine-specific DNA-methyltransferase
MQAQDLIKRVAEYDESLARDLQKFIGSRKLGLVYEESKPEYVRLWNKPVVEGDLVNVLPPRGIPENLSDDADEHDVIWRVAQINGNKARLLKVENGDLRDASLDDLVAVARFDQNIYCGLRETGRVERGGDKPYQVVINGENFHALESLLFAYKGKVDCIYIDPPYNTGAKDWKYNNNYVGQDDRYRHSKWLTFMEDRLRVAKQLLNPENSVLICTIDEKEYLRLGLLLENIFSSDDFTIQMVSDVINPAGVSRKGEFSRTNEFIYVVMRGNSAPNKLPLDDAWLGNIRSRSRNKLTWDNLRRRGTNARRVDRPNLFYPIYLNSAGTKIVDLGPSLSISESRQSIEAPDGCQIVWPLFANGDEGNWQLSQGSLRPLIEKGYVKLGRPSRGGRAIRYLKAGERKKVESGLFPIIGRNPDGSIQVDDADYKARYVPGTSWLIPSHDSTQHGSRLLRSVIPNHKFPFPKSLYAVEDVIRFFVADKPNALIVEKIRSCRKLVFRQD